MKTSMQEFLKNEKLPKFIINNKTLKSIDKISKVFPSIGLVNSKEECIIDNIDIAKETGYKLAYKLTSLLLGKSSKSKLYHLSGERCKQLHNWIAIFSYMMTEYKSFVRLNNGLITLKLFEDIKNGDEILFRKEESLFKVYNKIKIKIKNLKAGIVLPELDSIAEFKRFSIDNVPSKKYHIVFSSVDCDGLWDIATMSMRGITSCQKWSGKYKQALIGSLIDPFVGIMYLTSGSDVNGLGSRMMKRIYCKIHY